MYKNGITRTSDTNGFDIAGENDPIIIEIDDIKDIDIKK